MIGATHVTAGSFLETGSRLVALVKGDDTRTLKLTSCPRPGESIRLAGSLLHYLDVVNLPNVHSQRISLRRADETLEAHSKKNLVDPVRGSRVHCL